MHLPIVASIFYKIKKKTVTIVDDIIIYISYYYCCDNKNERNNAIANIKLREWYAKTERYFFSSKDNKLVRA